MVRSSMMGIQVSSLPPARMTVAPQPPRTHQPSSGSAVGDYDATIGASSFRKRRQRAHRLLHSRSSGTRFSPPSWAARSYRKWSPAPWSAAVARVHHPYRWRRQGSRALRFESGAAQPLQSLRAHRRAGVGPRSADKVLFGACSAPETRWPGANRFDLRARKHRPTPMWCGWATSAGAVGKQPPHALDPAPWNQRPRTCMREHPGGGRRAISVPIHRYRYGHHANGAWSPSDQSRARSTVAD